MVLTRRDLGKALVWLFIFPIHCALSQSAFKPDAAFEQKELESLKAATLYQDNNGDLPPRNAYAGPPILRTLRLSDVESVVLVSRSAVKPPSEYAKSRYFIWFRHMLSSREDHRQSSEFGSPRREFAQLDPKSLAGQESPEK